MFLIAIKHALSKEGKIMNKNLENVKSSASITMMQKAAELKAQGVPVIDLAGGEPDFDTPLLIRNTAIEALRNGHTHYAVGKGIKELRQSIAEKMARENSVTCDAEQVIVTPGGKYGIYMVVATLINPGDEVIILAPYWVSYEPIVRLCGGIPVIVELDYANQYRIEKDLLKKAVSDKTKLLIINYPNNPTGKILHQNEAESLKELILETGIYVISDEIYEKIVYDGKKNISLASIEAIKSHVITVNGFSKCAAMTGWRIGYTVAEEAIINAMYKLFVHTITGVSTFIQEAAVKVFLCEKEMEEMRLTYQKRRDYMVQELKKIQKFRCELPEGAFYLWIHIETEKNAQEACEELLERTGIIMVPGDGYGENKEVYVRCCIAVEQEQLQLAVEHLKKVFLP